MSKSNNWQQQVRKFKQLMFFWNNKQLESQLASGKIVSKQMTASLSLRPAAPFADLSTGHVSRLEMDEGISAKMLMRPNSAIQ